MLEAQRHALDVRNRLRQPGNGRQSSELDIVSTTGLRRKQIEQRQAEDQGRAALRLVEGHARQLAGLRERLRISEVNLVVTRGKLATAEHELQCFRKKEEAVKAAIQNDSPQQEVLVRVPLKRILETVAEHFDIPLGGLVSKRRTPIHMKARKIAYYLANDDSIGGMTLASIGRRMDRDHTSVLHSVRIVSEAVKSGENDIAAHVAVLTEKVCA